MCASKLLGHASVAFALQTYTHSDDDELDRAGVALQRALGAG
jgi:integrase